MQHFGLTTIKCKHGTYNASIENKASIEKDELQVDAV
jgi:hypothetical protein